MNEAETRFQLIDPKLKASGWETPPHSIAPEQMIAPGRIVPMGKSGRREKTLLPSVLDWALKGEL